jgi:hypothetical protein
MPAGAGPSGSGSGGRGPAFSGVVVLQARAVATTTLAMKDQKERITEP